MSLKINIFTPGSNDKAYQKLIAEYEKRISRFAEINWRIVKTGDRKTENQHLREVLCDTRYIALDEHGQHIPTKEIAKVFSKVMQSGKPEINLVIGGAFGLEEDLISSANEVWAFGSITLPHQLVRLIVSEQCYRAMTIIHNHPYHHS